jgi:3-methyladenine DNA glycosylase AlkC
MVCIIAPSHKKNATVKTLNARKSIVSALAQESLAQRPVNVKIAVIHPNSSHKRKSIRNYLSSCKTLKLPKGIILKSAHRAFFKGASKI